MTDTAVPAADPGASPAAAAPVAPPARASNLVGAGILIVWLGLGAALAAAHRPPHVITFAFVMVGWLLSVMVHEFSHAYVGWKAGDHTVLAKGYLGFDPRRYGSLQTTLIIPIAALALGGIGFPGGAVYLRAELMRGRGWRAAAALAGPAATAAVLVVIAVTLRIWLAVGRGGGELFAALSMLGFLQAMALILNLLPLPGLDGFNAIRPFLPASMKPAILRAQALAPLILLGLIFFVPGAGAALFRAAIALSTALGLLPSAMQYGWNAFHFWW